MSQTELQSSASYQQIFQEAVRNGDTTELQKILQNREGAVNVNLYDKEGQTALHQSCMDGNLELVKLLVKFGADVKLANRDGWSAFHIAAYGGHQDIVLYLISSSRRCSTTAGNVYLDKLTEKAGKVLKHG